MKGKYNPQPTMLAFVNLEQMAPGDHPIRAIKDIVDRLLQDMSDELDSIYSNIGRASIPPERLLKALLPISLYSIRSERAFCEELRYNMLYQ